MVSQNSPDRLTEMLTEWEEVRLAQRGPPEKVQDARGALYLRYAGAIRRYLLAALNDTAAAEDLCQEFAVAVLEGKIQGANPEQGRFRDYIKGMLFHLVSQYRRRQKRQPLLGGVELEEHPDVARERERLFDQSWRDELLARTWAALVEEHPTYFTLLHFRASHPDMRPDEMIAELLPQLGKKLTRENLRQGLHRARKMFADLLVREVAQSLVEPTLDTLQQELFALELGPYLRGRASALRTAAALHPPSIAPPGP